MMIPTFDPEEDAIRDGIETMPELADIEAEAPEGDTVADFPLDQGLIESFPASDTPGPEITD